MMSKPCLEASLFVTPIFIYSEAGVFFWGWGYAIGPLVENRFDPVNRNFGCRSCGRGSFRCNFSGVKMV